MLQSALDTLMSYGRILLDLRFSLLIVGLAYVVHVLIKWRREQEVNNSHLTQAENDFLTAIGGCYLQQAAGLSAHESEISLPMAFWPRRTLRAV